VIAPTTTAASATAPNSSGASSNPASTTAASSHGSTHINPTSIPASLPPGLISLISPATTSGVTSYYSVGSPLTFVWNYTYLIATPTALDILATANAPGLAIPTPFTLALNQSFTSPQTFTWDTGKYAQETPLPAGTYTLIVYDADAENGRWQLAQAGKLSSWSGFSWGMYNTQQYTPLENAYVCATCNGAGGLKVGRETWVMLVGTVGVVMGAFLIFT